MSKDILSEDLDSADTNLINDSVRFSVFDIRDALNCVEDMTFEQKMSVFYVLNVSKESCLDND